MSKYMALAGMILCATGGQTLLKYTFLQRPKIGDWTAFREMVFSPSFVAGTLLTLIGPFLYLYALTGLPLKTAFSFNGLNYCTIFLSSWLILKEKINLYHFVGIGFVVAGVTVFNL